MCDDGQCEHHRICARWKDTQYIETGVHSRFLTEQEFKKPNAQFLIESELGDSKNIRNFKSQSTFLCFSACCQKMRMLPEIDP